MNSLIFSGDLCRNSGATFHHALIRKKYKQEEYKSMIPGDPLRTPELPGIISYSEKKSRKKEKMPGDLFRFSAAPGHIRNSKKKSKKSSLYTPGICSEPPGLPSALQGQARRKARRDLEELQAIPSGCYMPGVQVKRVFGR
jgi:hypothetical protein